MLPIIILNSHQQLFNYLDIKHSSLPALLIVTALHHDQHSQTGVDRLIEFITKASITETKVCNHQTDQLKTALVSECGQTTLQRGRWKQKHGETFTRLTTIAMGRQRKGSVKARTTA
jgi:hypothetical protein